MTKGLVIIEGPPGELLIVKEPKRVHPYDGSLGKRDIVRRVKASHFTAARAGNK
jgi:hypothetical protein